MSIRIHCDGGCGQSILQQGPNVSAVVIPDGWVQLSIERKLQPTMIQHQCGACFGKAQRAAVEAANSLPKLPKTGP